MIIEGLFKRDGLRWVINRDESKELEADPEILKEIQKIIKDIK